MVSCAAEISDPTHSFEARDMWHGVLLAELRFLDQLHVNSVLLQDVCKLVEFCSQGITHPLYDTELMEGKAWSCALLCMGEIECCSGCVPGGAGMAMAGVLLFAQSFKSITCLGRALNMKGTHAVLADKGFLGRRCRFGACLAFQVVI